MTGGKILAKEIIDNELVLITSIQRAPRNWQETSNPMKKWVKDVKREFTKINPHSYNHEDVQTN